MPTHPWQHPMRDTTHTLASYQMPVRLNSSQNGHVQWHEMRSLAAPEQSGMAARRMHDSRMACTADSLLAGMPPLDTTDEACRGDDCALQVCI